MFGLNVLVTLDVNGLNTTIAIKRKLFSDYIQKNKIQLHAAYYSNALNSRVTKYFRLKKMLTKAKIQHNYCKNVRLRRVEAGIVKK